MPTLPLSPLTTSLLVSTVKSSPAAADKAILSAPPVGAVMVLDAANVKAVLAKVSAWPVSPMLSTNRLAHRTEDVPKSSVPSVSETTLPPWVVTPVTNSVSEMVASPVTIMVSADSSHSHDFPVVAPNILRS